MLEWLRSFLGSTLDSEAWLGECLNNYSLESFRIVESGMFWFHLDPLVSFRSYGMKGGCFESTPATLRPNRNLQLSMPVSPAYT